MAWHEEYQRLQDKLRNLERDIDLVIAPFLDAPLRSEAEEEEKEEGSEGTETMNASQSSVQQVPFKGKEEGEGAEDSESVAGAVSPDSLAEGSGGDSGEGADAAPSRRGIRFADDSKPPAATTTSGSAGNRQSEAKSNTLLLGRYWDALTAEREADNAALLSQFRGIHMLLGSLKRLRADTAAAEAAPQIDSLSSNLGRVLQSLRESLRNSTKTLEKEGHLLEEEVSATLMCGHRYHLSSYLPSYLPTFLPSYLPSPTSPLLALTTYSLWFLVRFSHCTSFACGCGGTSGECMLSHLGNFPPRQWRRRWPWRGPLSRFLGLHHILHWRCGR